MPGFAFHAAAPAGEWLNDPNALFFRDGRYHLYAQHAADAPDFRQIGWGAFSSGDLIDWHWEGVTIAPNELGFAYSGSVVANGAEFETFLTRHDPVGRWQTQERRLASADVEIIGPAGKNCRDPFVFFDKRLSDWRMLVARPCDWHNWASEGPSIVEIWRSDDRHDWQYAGQIGPWHPPGVMWEVPVLIDFGQVQALILSIVDRRGGAADCHVEYRLGQFGGNDFLPSGEYIDRGLPLDLGPDFYAAIPNLAAGWPTNDRVLVGWASNWSTARTMVWPRGHGGPISMPRVVELDGAVKRLVQRPLAGFRPWDTFTAGLRGSYVQDIWDNALNIVWSEDKIEITLLRLGLPDHAKSIDFNAVEGQAFVFFDAMLLEIFFPGGVTFTAALPMS